jgi:hypothetical protein
MRLNRGRSGGSARDARANDREKYKKGLSMALTLLLIVFSSQILNGVQEGSDARESGETKDR